MCLLLKKQLQWNVMSNIRREFICMYTQRQRLMSIVSNENDMPIKLKGRLASQEQTRIISEFITESDSTNLNWNKLKESVFNIKRGYINERNINGCILEICSKQKRLDLAKSYMRYIKECGQTKPNTILQLLYIRSCYASQDQLTDEDQHEIQTICLSILKNNSHLVNSTFMEGIIMGLCCTPLWRNSLEYLNNFKNEKDIKIRAYSCTIFKAFKEEEIDIGWSLIQTMYNQHEILLTSVFAAWFNLCDINKNYSYQKVLEFLRDNECIVRTHLAELIHEKYKQYGSKITTTIIKPDGRCTNCNQILKPVEITNSEFKALQESFMSRVVIGKNIFNNSSPQELNNFKDFIKNTAPYDVVVDGLNVAYAYRGKIANDSLIKIVLKILIKQKSKVLLFGRKHLVQQLGNEFNFIKRNVNIFFADDLSKDDPFLLYAAMYSGIQTKILTRDLMRGHKFLLNNSKMQNIFQKWLQKNRLILKIRPQNEVFIRNPIPYLQTTQESGKGIWHLPYEEIKEPGSWSKPNSSPDNWMCIKTLD